MTAQQKLLRDRAICVIIPTYNNVGTIADVIARSLAQCADVIVVNDGSTDGTAELLRSTGGITLVDCERNGGKGRALRLGFERALEMGFAYAITLDGDGQHYPEDIPLFLQANQQHPGCLIVGSRRLEGKERSRGSRFANGFSNFWFAVETWQWLPDTQTGYRLYPLKKLRGLKLLTSRYEAELELLVFAAWHGVRLVPISVDVYYPPREERVSHFRPGPDFARISVLNCVLCALSVVYALPLRLWRWTATVLRSLVGLVFFLVMTLLIITPAVWVYVHIGRLTEKKRMNLHKILQGIARFVMIHAGVPGTRFSYKLDDASVFDTPHVIVCNHQSHLDLMCQLVFTPRVVFLTKDWVWNNPFYGFFIRRCEFYPVSTGVEELLPRLQSLVSRGYSIAVYPEGTRSADCRIGRFHQGAFHIAQELGLGLLPMCLYGAGKVLPKTSHHLHKGLIRIDVGAPVSREELSAMGDTLAQARTMRKRYEQWYAGLANRMEQEA